MKNLLRTEEAMQFLLCLGMLIMNDVPWWVYPLLILGPDIGMLGYLVGPRTGAFTYNLFHHKGVAIAVAFLSFPSEALSMLKATPDLASSLFISGVVLFGHASMDRIFGYGLKFMDGFHHTHLGWIGGARTTRSEV